MRGSRPKDTCKHEWIDEMKIVRPDNPNYQQGDAYFAWAWCKKCKKKWYKDYKQVIYEDAIFQDS